MTQEVFAANIKSLMKKANGLGSQAALAKASEIDQRTVGRIINCEHSPSLDKVYAIANALRVKPWQLLVPGISASALPVLSTEIQDWPFSLIAKERYEALSHDRQIAVQLKMREAMEKEEAEVRAEMPKQANSNHR